MLCWFGIIAAADDPPPVVEGHASVLRLIICPITGAHRFMMALSLFSVAAVTANLPGEICKDLQKYNCGNI